ncbi:MAG: formate dehydrogenase accessory sulfurtransferase FdhD [Thermoleophilia bacterium]
MTTSHAAGSARPGPSVPIRVLRLRGGRWSERADRLAGEEPLEVRLAAAGAPAVRVAVTMRTPGADFPLAVGLLVTEGVVHPGDLAGVSYCTDPGESQAYNVVLVRSAHAPRAVVAERAHAISAACGVCGKTSLDQVRVRCAVLPDGPGVAAATLLGMADTLRGAQPGFDRTGATHAAGLFDAHGRLVAAFEDVGRHNAVDKVVGDAVLHHRAPGADAVLLVSGRLSFEIVQKAAVAGIPVVAAVSGPSSLAVEAAAELGVTAVGFLREDRMNVYTHPRRVLREV